MGLPNEDQTTMQKTLDLSVELCTSGWNMYTAMALPGSALYKHALNNKYPLPESYEAYSWSSYSSTPMPTEYLLQSQILEFRDKAFNLYHTNPNFLQRVKTKFGEKAVQNILDMVKVKLKRKVIEDALK